ncbi:MAG: BlaI/MecI/CopY family transcriptional regulator [Vicinamibacterales bacterium]
MSKHQRSLPAAEQELLAILYELGEATAREVREHLPAARSLAHPTVVTLLNRLEARKLVRRRKAETGKAFVYRPTRDRDGAFAPLVAGLAGRLFKGSPAALVASLFETHPPDASDLAEIEALLADWRSRTGGRKERR